jgi:hypothetical protein
VICPANNQFVRVTRRTKRQREKANSPVVQVVQLESPLERLSDCRTVPYLRFFLVRNEEAEASNPFPCASPAKSRHCSSPPLFFESVCWTAGKDLGKNSKSQNTT